MGYQKWLTTSPETPRHERNVYVPELVSAITDYLWKVHSESPTDKEMISKSHVVNSAFVDELVPLGTRVSIRRHINDTDHIFMYAKD